MISRNEIKRALSILMLSPIYFKMTLSARHALVKEYCLLHNQPDV